MKVAIRSDASEQIGPGHIIRCLILGRALQERGAKVSFVCREHTGNLVDMISGEGFEVFKLRFDQGADENSAFKKQESENQHNHASWLGVKQETDARQTVHVLQNESLWDWLIVDHYALDAKWETALRIMANKVMVIDDLADRKHDCDLLVDQNYFEKPGDRYQELLPGHCDLLLGPKYALIRPSILQAQKFCKMRGNGIARALVYFGDYDPENLTGLVIEAFKSPELRHLFVEVILGPNNPHLKKIEKQVRERTGTRLHIQPEGFTELVLRSDLFIGAGGVNTWERLCLGLPSLVISFWQKQGCFIGDLYKTGYVRLLDIKDRNDGPGLLESLKSAIEQFKNNALFSNSPNLVDGFGVLRVLEKLMPAPQESLGLRAAGFKDSELFYFWVNDLAGQENAFQDNALTCPEHVRWFNEKIASKNVNMWMLETSSGLPVGQIRFDVQDGVADINYSVDPLVRGRGWGKTLLKLGLKEFKEIHQHGECGARIKLTNAPSIKCFQKIGFIRKYRSKGDYFSIAVISNEDSWINDYIPDLLFDWLQKGHSVLWAHSPLEVSPGDFCFMLGYGKLVPKSTLKMFKNNLVVHESDLPRGKGWSPLSWQIIEGKNKIPVTLFEANENVDSGLIYARDWITFQGHELVDELRKKQAETTMELCKKFVYEYPKIVAQGREQQGEGSFYPRRKPENSRLDPDKSLTEQFRILRVVDNERYPAFFEFNSQKYSLKIEKI